MGAGRSSHWEAREDLAAAFRWAARLGWQAGICNHFSLAVDEARVLINPHGLHWSEITPSALLLVDHEGYVLEGDGEVETTAIFVHLPIHAQGGATRCVLHAHTPYATAIACTDGGRLEPCHQDALRFHDRVVYDETFNGAVTGLEEGRRIAAALGDRPVLFMVHHGVTVVGPGVAKALDDLYYLEKACQYQVLAASSGRPLKVMDEETVSRTLHFFFESDPQIELHLAAIKRLLDRDEPGWRD
jgi:ribulose-5-phosphate 4-epimerase/fuculose-1-phosphate aldolase